MDKIIIYGGKGWIGSQFCEILKNNNITFIILNTRVNNYIDVEKDIITHIPSHIISFTGRTHGIINGKQYHTIDYLEQPGKLKENIRDNLMGPLIISTLCKKYNIHYTYLGTGCIFKYDETHPYEKEINGFNENDIPNFFGSNYSIVKGATDQLLYHLNNDTTLNLRIRMPITNIDEPRNFITKITTYKKICSIKNSMTVLPELLPIVLKMMKSKQTGTINLVNPGLISHNEILEMYKKYVDPKFTWKNFTKEEQDKILDSDRSNNYLDTQLLKSLYPEVNNIKDSIKNILINYIKKEKKEIFQLNIKNLLVTGGCGFIGSNFINYFYKNYPNINIINMDALYYCANEKNIKEEIRNDTVRYHLIKGNLCSDDLVNHILNYYNIDTIIHFAAQSHVQSSFEQSLQYTKDNILGTHTLLECCRFFGKIKKFIHVSTDEVYGESLLEITEKQKSEQSILTPTNPYAASKAAAEAIVQSYIKSFNMPIIITRGNNVYGPNQYFEKVIPKFIYQLKNNEKITIHGDGSCIRGFLHVNDTINAFIKILEKGIIGEIYNIGCDEDMEISILELAKKIHKLLNIKSNFEDNIIYIEDRPFNDKRYYITNKKLKNLGWKININFDTGLKQII